MRVLLKWKSKICAKCLNTEVTKAKKTKKKQVLKTRSTKKGLIVTLSKHFFCTFWKDFD